MVSKIRISKLKYHNAFSLYSTAAKNKLSSEELCTGLGSAVGTLPKQALQVIRHVWNEQGNSIAGSEDANNIGMVGQVSSSRQVCRGIADFNRAQW